MKIREIELLSLEGVILAVAYVTLSLGLALSVWGSYLWWSSIHPFYLVYLIAWVVVTLAAGISAFSSSTSFYRGLIQVLFWVVLTPTFGLLLMGALLWMLV